jgi:hypothetical protein
MMPFLGDLQAERLLLILAQNIERLVCARILRYQGAPLQKIGLFG